MRDRVTWLFIWITLAFWSGCTTAGSDDQNYKINNEPHPIFKEGEPTNLELPPAEPVAEKVRQPTASELDKPSLTNGVNRYHWPKQVVTNVSGQVKHHPVYFSGSDWRMLDIEKIEPENWHRGTLKTASYFRFREPRAVALDSPNVESSPDAMELRVVRVLSDNRYETDKRDTAELVVLPMKFMYDVLVWPIRMAFVDPPTSQEISPAD